MTHDQKFSIEIYFNVAEGLFESGCENLEREIQDELERASAEILNLTREIKKFEKELSQPSKLETKQPQKDANKTSKKEEEKKEENHG